MRALGGLLLLYTVTGFLIAPYLIERNLPGLAQEHLARSQYIPERARPRPIYRASRRGLGRAGRLPEIRRSKYLRMRDQVIVFPKATMLV